MHSPRFAGGGAVTPEAAEVMRRSASYVRVRVMGMPFLLVGNVLTAALLGAKDSLSPLYAMLAASLTNVVGDVYAVKFLQRGVQGAAEATLVAQIVSRAGPRRKARLRNIEFERQTVFFPPRRVF